MLYKIIPFLVWFGCYSQQIGHQKVPSLAEMYSSRLQAVGYWTFLAGLAIVCPGILAASELAVRIGCGTLALSVGCFAINLALILSHFAKSRPVPGIVRSRSRSSLRRASLQPPVAAPTPSPANNHAAVRI
jgi:hypothetical protein